MRVPLSLIIGLIVFASAIATPVLAKASLVSYSFSGRIVGVLESPYSGFSTGAHVGDEFSGTLSYDPSVAPTVCAVDGCRFDSFVRDLAFTINGQSLALDPTSIQGSDGSPGSHGAVTLQCLGGPPCIPTQVFNFDAALASRAGDAPESFRAAAFIFGSTSLNTLSSYGALPKSLKPISAFDYRYDLDGFIAGPLFASRVLGGGGYAEAVGQITELKTIPAVPEPATYALFAVALAGLFTLSRVLGVRSCD